jgi:CrcB protein
MKQLAACLWVGLGGFAGAVARHLIATVARRLAGVAFPYGTFFINVSGSFLLGLLVTFLADRTLPRTDELRLALAVGFLGAYTTFSTFELEAHALFEHGRWATASLYVFGSVLLGFAGLRAGIALARQWH